MDRFLLVAKDLPVSGLLARIPSDMWVENTTRQDYVGTAHKDTETVFLRWAEDFAWASAVYDLTAHDYPAAEALLPEAHDLVESVLKAIGTTGYLARVIIVKLKSGGRIAPHADAGPYADAYDRFHICLSSEPGATMYVAGTPRHMAPGECWWVNHKQEHWAENTSDVDRIHMILDVEAPAYRAKRGVYFQQEMFDEMYNEGGPLIQAHYEEITANPDIPLAPDVDRYHELEQAGKLRVFTARDCGTLIGYVIVTVAYGLHYKTSLQATQDVVYLAPEYRGKRIGMRFLDYVDDNLRKEGVQVVYQHSKIAHPALGRMLERIGYTAVETVYQRRL